MPAELVALEDASVLILPDVERGRTGGRLRRDGDRRAGGFWRVGGLFLMHEGLLISRAKGR